MSRSRMESKVLLKGAKGIDLDGTSRVMPTGIAVRPAMRTRRIRRLTCLVLVLSCTDCSSRESTGSPDTAVDVLEDSLADTGADVPVDARDDTWECVTDDECDDVNPCTSDACIRWGHWCSHDPVDADEDGYPAAIVDGVECGGTDCDDDDPRAHPEGHPGCGTGDTDLDCNGNVDSDNDGDGFVNEDCPGLAGDDCNDGDPATHPGADEVCNDGNDQDCDTVVDGPVRMIPDVVLVNEEGDSWQASLAWTGSEFGVSWDDWRSGMPEIYFSRISAAGEKMGPDVRVIDDSDSARYSSIVWTGSEFGVSWSDFRNREDEIFFARVSADGSPIGANVRLTDGSGESQWSVTAWTGSEFAVAYQQQIGTDPTNLYYSRISTGGIDLGADVRLTDAVGHTWWAGLAWTGSEFGLSWRESYIPDDVRFVRHSAEGEIHGPVVALEDSYTDCAAPSIAWSGSEFAVAFKVYSEPDPRMDFVRLTASGARVGPVTTIATSTDNYIYLSAMDPTLVWGGSVYAVSWLDARRIPAELYFRLISPAGELLGPELYISTGAMPFRSPTSLAWTGSSYGLVWAAHTEWTETDLMFTVIGLCD